MLSSRDIADLEAKYSKYIIKKRFKLFLIVLVVTLILFSTLYFFYFNYMQNQSETPSKKPTKKIKKITALVNLKHKDIASLNRKVDKIKKIENPDKNLTAKKELNTTKINQPIKLKKSNFKATKKEDKRNDEFFFKLNPSDNLSSEHDSEHKLTFSIKKEDNNSVKNIKEEIDKDKNLDKNDTILTVKRKKKKINIIMKDIDSISYLKRKFNKTHDIVFALMLCENYYSIKDFKNSLKWSIIANDIDSSSERSWIWFAKSKYKLNQKDDAIKALKAFLKSNDSQNVKSLLRDITNGELND